MSNVIFHIDINAFFASAEEIRDPLLKDKPVAVSHNSRKSVVTTANYVARSFGVRSAMPLSKAKELCPHLTVVDVHFSFYEELSNKFMTYLRTYTDLVEPASIDEAYVDMSEIIKTYQKPLDLAVKIQRDVYDQFSLPISIGIAPNKFLAKMASDFKKPMGISVLRKREIKEKLWPLDIHEMNGIGKKTEVKLRELSINTIGDLANASVHSLEQVLGNTTLSMIEKANGIDQRPIINVSSIQSISQSRTLSEATSDDLEIKEMIGRLSYSIAHRCQDEDRIAKGISLSCRFEGFKTQVQSIRFDIPTCEYEVIYQHALYLYDQFQSEGMIDFIGLNLYDLVEEKHSKYQLNLFSLDKDDSTESLVHQLNEVFNANLLKSGKDYFKDKDNYE